MVLFPEVGMLEEGQVWSGRISCCIGGAFELSQRRSQIGHTLCGKCVVFRLDYT